MTDDQRAEELTAWLQRNGISDRLTAARVALALMECKDDR
jgi:hypothetical protein